VPPSNLLVDGVFHETRVVPSLGIAAVTGYARQQGLQVEMFAPNITRMTEADATREILRRRPALLGFSLLTRFSYAHVQQVLDGLREGGLHAFVCMGGHFASLAYERILRDRSDVDCVVVGDGEVTFAELLCALRNGSAWQQLPGIASRTTNGVTFAGNRGAPPLDSYPMMALDFLEALVERYGTEVRVSLVSSRGCYADCSYCSIRSYAQLTKTRPYRMRSIGRLVDEIEYIQQTYDVRNFALEDDNFLVPGPVGIQRARDFGQAVRTRGLDFRLFLQTRPECITYEAISALKDVGLCDIFIGTESFDQETLDLYHRNNTVEETIHAFEVFESLGFSASVDAERRVRVGSMVFHPYVTLDRLYKQAQFFRRFDIPSKKLIKYLFPVEDVDLCRRLEREGLLGPDGRYRFVHRSVQQVHDALRAYYDRFMVIRESIRWIEKVTRLQRLTLDLTELRDARRAIEGNFLDLFEILCLEGEYGQQHIDRACDMHAGRLASELDLPSLRALVDERVRDLEGFAVHD
jgi:hypothetical protein